MKRRLILGGAAAAALIGGTAIVTTLPDDSAASDQPATDVDADVEIVEVARGDLRADVEFVGEASFGEEWSLPLPEERNGDGIITWAPDPGTIVEPGEVLVYVDDEPLFVVQGSTPLYRDLERTSPPLEGPDVLQLQQYLAFFGYDVEPDGEFGWKTERAVKQWQDDNGLDDTGVVTRQHMVFVGEPIRVSSDLRVGTRVDELLLTDGTPLVVVDTSNRDRAALPEGSDVEIRFADGTTVAGVVVEQRQITDDNGDRIWRTTIEPTGEIPGDASIVDVLVIDERATDVLLVPVRALIALAEGSYGVEVRLADGSSELRQITVGEVVDGMAEVSGDVDEGDQLVVPR
ncbi:MAG: peptidoglycan-binding domain-containing protein [Actinomycetota bacterium]